MGLKVNEDLHRDMKAGAIYGLGQAVARALADERDEVRIGKRGVRVWGARTCIVSGVLDDGERDFRVR